MKNKKCPRCGEPSQSKKGGFCSACKSWWYRVQTMNAAEAARYAENFGLRLLRMEGRAKVVLKMRRG